MGEEGFTIKAIAFNVLISELFVLKIKKDNKVFNIAGKLSQMRKGQSNVEFIIDDISVIKTFKK